MYINTEKPVLVTSHGRVTQSKGYWHKGNTLKKHLLIIFTKGSLKMKIADKVYNANSGDALLIPKSTLYVPLESSGCEYYFFHFSAPDSKPNQADLNITTNTKLPEGEYSFSYSFDTSPVIEVTTLTKSIDLRAQSVLERISRTNVWQNYTEKLLLDCYLRELLTLLNADRSKSHGVDQNLRKIIRYIDQNYKTDISLSSLASTFGISQSYVARLFKENLHTCSCDYINSVRIRHACDLLLNSKLTIGAIAEKVGFNNQYYFSRVFKTRLGITPNQFRNRKTV